jgi:hypothetical protein
MHDSRVAHDGCRKYWFTADVRYGFEVRLRVQVMVPNAASHDIVSSSRKDVDQAD